MPVNPYRSEYQNTSSAISNYDGDLDDITINPETFEDDGNYGLDNLHYATLDDELDPVSMAAEEPMELDFNEGLSEDTGIEAAYDAKVDAQLQQAANRLNPQRIERILESTYSVPKADGNVKTLAEYVKVIQSDYNKYISEKLEKYSK